MFAIHYFARIKISISINLNVSVITSCSANAVSKCQTHIQAANIVFAEKIDLCFRKIHKEVSNAGDLLNELNENDQKMKCLLKAAIQPHQMSHLKMEALFQGKGLLVL